MYKLYSDIAGWKMIDISENEKDIVDTIGEYISKNVNGRIFYTIVLSTDNQDIPYKSIKKSRRICRVFRRL